MSSNEQVEMKIKGNDTITTNKEADVFDCAYVEVKNPHPTYVFLSLLI
jgi:hypothetical protein